MTGSMDGPMGELMIGSMVGSMSGSRSWVPFMKKSRESCMHGKKFYDATRSSR